MSLKDHFIGQHLSNAIADKGHASLVTCGGSSPLPIFASLANYALDWSKVSITLVDDRMVPAHHPDSNDRLIREQLLTGTAQEAQYISLYQDPKAVAALPRPFDVMLLGIGTDGHFASLFPDMIDDEQAFGLNARPEIIRTGVKGSPAHARISMNLAMILQSRAIFILAIDPAKQQVIEQAANDSASGDLAIPVAHLLKQQVTHTQLITDLNL